MRRHFIYLLILSLFSACSMGQPEVIKPSVQYTQEAKTFIQEGKQRAAVIKLNKALKLSRNEDDVALQIEQLMLLSKLTGDTQSAQEALELATLSHNAPLKLEAEFAYGLALYPEKSALPYFKNALDSNDAKVHTLSLIYIYKLTGNITYLKRAALNYDDTRDEVTGLLNYEEAEASSNSHEKIVLLKKALQIDKSLCVARFIKRDLEALCDATKLISPTESHFYCLRAEKITP